MNAKDYLKRYILCKGQTIDKNGEIIGGTSAGKENVRNRIDSISPYLEDYARLYHESEIKKLHKHGIILRFAKYLEKTGTSVYADIDDFLEQDSENAV